MWRKSVTTLAALSLLAHPPTLCSDHVAAPPPLQSTVPRRKYKKKKESDLKKLVLMSGTAHPNLAQEVSAALARDLADTSISRFNDGEVSIRMNESVRGKNVFVIQPCGAPVSDSIMELLLLVSCARRDGAKRIIAVVPYFAFKHHRHIMPESSKYSSRFLFSNAMDFAKMLREMGVDRVICVDLQRPGQGQEACVFPTAIPLEVIVTHDLMMDHFIEQVPLSREAPIVVVAPNDELLKKALKFQRRLIAAYPDQDVQVQGYASKETASVYDITDMIPLNNINMKGASVILVDDIIDTAKSISTVAEQLKAQGARSIHVVASHGLFSGNAVETIENSSIDQVFVTNTLPFPVTPTSKVTSVSISPLLSHLIWTEHFQKDIGCDEEYVIEGAGSTNLLPIVAEKI